jgi:hypothetical protein
MTAFLQPGEVAQPGTQVMPHSNVSWDAVFAVNGTSSRLIAYVEGQELAQFFADKLNEAQEATEPSIRLNLTAPQKKLLIEMFEERVPDGYWLELHRHDKVPANSLKDKGLLEIRTGGDDARLTPAGRAEARRLTFRI